MLKNILRFEYKINEKIYHFMCDNDSPIEHLKEVLFQFQKYVGQIEDQIKTQQAQVQSEQSSVTQEETKSE